MTELQRIVEDKFKQRFWNSKVNAPENHKALEKKATQHPKK